LGGRPLRLGFLALTDAAPFAVAQHQGIFAKHGLRVELSREVGWATIREKIIYGELDAAHCLAPLLWATHLGIDSVPCSVLTGMVLSLHGNALTLSNRLWISGVRDAVSLRDEARRRIGERKLTFGVVFAHSSHHVLLRTWLASGGINPDRDVRIVVVPPAQMFRNLAAGTIDGYCAGEPWNTLAVRENVGWCPTWSAASSLCPVEKVLMVTQRFAAERATEHQLLIAALTEACAWCDEPSNREPLAQLLGSSNYINQSSHVIAPSLLGQFDCGHGRLESVPDFHVFHRDSSNVPTVQKAEALQQDLLRAGLLRQSQITADLPAQLFREDIFQTAPRNPLHHELVSS
jgi:ABC-type nitrate/sulfonate/bicarbonate transport system substrate-binding protein